MDCNYCHECGVARQRATQHLCSTCARVLLCPNCTQCMGCRLLVRAAMLPWLEEFQKKVMKEDAETRRRNQEKEKAIYAKYAK